MQRLNLKQGKVYKVNYLYAGIIRCYERSFVGELKLIDLDGKKLYFSRWGLGDINICKSDIIDIKEIKSFGKEWNKIK